MDTFTLPKWPTKVEVTLPSNITKDQLLEFRPFKDWLQTLKKSLEEQNKSDHVFNAKENRYTLRSINIQSVDWFGTMNSPRIGFVKMETVVKNSTHESPLPGIVFLRGGSVAILMIVRPEGQRNGKRYVIMTQQPRIPAGSLSFFEIPAGMIDDEKNFSGAAARELYEETGLTIPEDQLTDMTAKALRNSTATEAHLQHAMYPSPGGCDEFISLFLWEGTKSWAWMNELTGKFRGTDKEKILCKLVPYEELWKEGARDAKTLAAWALYEGLTKDRSFEEVEPVRQEGSKFGSFWAGAWRFT